MHLQGSTTGTQTPSFLVTDMNLVGVLEPRFSQFAGSGDAASIFSTETDISPAIALYGDGHGRVGVWEWDRFGNDALDTGWVALTAPTGWSANSAMYRVQHGQFLTVKIDGFKNSAVPVGADGGITDEIFTGIPTWYRLADPSFYFKILWGSYPASAAINASGEVRIIAADSTGAARSVTANVTARGQSGTVPIPPVRKPPVVNVPNTAFASATATSVTGGGITVTSTASGTTPQVTANASVKQGISVSTGVGDSFTRADGALGANWIGTSSAPVILGNAVAGAGAVGYARWATSVAANTPQFSQMVWRSGPYASVLVGMGTAFTEGALLTTMSEFYGFRPNNLTAGVQIFSKTANASTNTILASSTTAVPSDGDIMRLEYNGTTLTGKINGATVLTATPTNPVSTTGVGMGSGSATWSATMLDDWSGGATAGTWTLGGGTVTPPATATTYVGACVTNGGTDATVVSKFGTGSCIRHFNANTLTVGPSHPAGSTKMHISYRPVVASVNNGSLDTTIEALIAKFNDGDIIEFWHEAENDGLTTAAADALMVAKSRLYDIKQTVNKNVLTCNTLVGGTLATWSTDALRDRWIGGVKADLIGLDADGVHANTAADATAKNYNRIDWMGTSTNYKCTDRAITWMQKFAAKGYIGWTVPEMVTEREPAWDPTGSIRAAWFKAQIDKALAKSVPPHLICIFDFNNATAVGGGGTTTNYIPNPSPELTTIKTYVG